MYNTLNGIRWVAMMEGNKRVMEMITSFVYLLKFSAQNKDRLISIRTELEILDHYVKLMKMRNDQFEFAVDLADLSLNDCCIIPFLLQPIVENAIFHGIIPLKSTGKIEVLIRREEGFVTTIVRDNGVGMNKAAARSLLIGDAASSEKGGFSKIGLSNVRDRLKLQFGSMVEMSVDSEEGGGTEIVLRWPARICVKEATHV
jgi:two-component system sensor histidine kinase YesM